ncbi:MAG TPA: adenylate/guanylate cyclase domain-containing protein [Thermohalobaculum sp.]|nr:adenylate/guanylate cyclase domain-containing protein [Thermohalobaculum sp.]
MLTMPETRYARCGTISIAYQVFGEGPVDLVLVPGWISNLDVMWEEPRLAAWLRQLGSFARVILFDKRGTGLSDRVTDTPMLEERMEDVRAVMEAVGSRQAALVGYSEGGPMCALFAATYPEMARAVVMIGSYPRRFRAEDFPIGPTEQEHEEFVAAIAANWGTHFALDIRAPSMQGDPRFQAWWSRYLRSGTSPTAAEALTRANGQIDIRAILPTIRVPVLLLHATGDQTCPVGCSRYMAERIPGARLVEIDSDDHLPWLEGGEVILREVEAFLTGERHAAAADRVLSTIMFTDIVGSTDILAETGDANWRALRSAHDEAVRGNLAAFNGREMNTMGDGFLALFDGPARAVRCAQNLCADAKRVGVSLRIGLHTGECELRGSDVSGLAVHTASRIADMAPTDGVLVSRTVRDLVAGSGLRFEPAGVHRLKGVPEEWQLYSVA